MTPSYRRQKKCLEILHDFTDKVIIARRAELFESIEMNAAESEKSEEKKNLALLDVLLQSTVDNQPMSDTDIREEVDTFMFAGHDTTTSGITFCLYNLAKHPEVQRKVCDELRNIIGDNARKPVTLKELNDLHYLDLVIKETLRIYPPVPLYGREVQEDVEISKKFELKNVFARSL